MVNKTIERKKTIFLLLKYELLETESLLDHTVEKEKAMSEFFNMSTEATHTDTEGEEDRAQSIIADAAEDPLRGGKDELGARRQEGRHQR